MSKFTVLFLCIAVAVATPLTRIKARHQPKHGNLLQELEDVGCFVMSDLMIQANYIDILTGTDIYTIFPPEDAAFDQALIDSLMADPELLTTFLNFHMSAGNITLGTFVNDATVTTLQGSTVRTNVYGSTYTIDGAAITLPDEWADNGMVQVINRVNFPIPAGNIPEVLAADAEGRFTTLLTAVEVAGLGETLAGGPFTLFAPTNAAFDALPEGVLDGLLADPEALGQVLLGHVAPSTVFAAGVASGTLQSAAGDNLVIVANPDGVTVDGANVIQTDLVAFNGVVHVIDAVI
ncbi:hypothetical protein QYM36_017965 [Artemia franciscana]|uniref:FAS1 domain-containing protein n=2 Tax=Artemia franciscana TaxID=6661 RepID=A0AA88H5F1_ARTSF|nr:hypothetical protein QYM36_017965 [Artemia franciscana]